jgi:succinyl-diaminopimelate desuccinylase
MHMADPVPLAQALIRCKSVTPADDDAQSVLATALRALGFTVHHVPFGDTPNLVAILGEGSPHFCFAGHTDVVPPGEGWHHGAFDATIDNGTLYGRGACDMKGAVAAFVAAVGALLRGGPPHGRISLLITGDEEGPAQHGTVRVLEWMAERGLTPDLCLVGEPTNPACLGDIIKIGRRGSLNATLTVHGTQGHAAYPQNADNPVHRLVSALSVLTAHELDQGNAWFEPSRLQVTSIDVGNAAFNVIPASAAARLNIRFNDQHTGASLHDWLRQTIAPHAPRFDLDVAVSGEAFLTKPAAFTQVVADAVQHVTGRTPRLDTGGGTSDARFISRFCPTAEFGLVGASMHRVDENVPLADLRALTEIYAEILRRVLA